MIFSNQHKFIFFAIPKTATHSVRVALQPFLGPEDWQQQALFGRDVSRLKEIAKIEHGHVSVAQIKPEVADWSTFYKFAIVRNPFDRFISICAFLNRKSTDFAGRELAWMKSAIRHPRFQSRILVKPQSSLLVNELGELDIDFIGRYESLQASLDTICDRLNLPKQTIGKTNTSEHREYRSLYDDELAELVLRYYEKDFELFNYPKSLV